MFNIFFDLGLTLIRNNIPELIQDRFEKYGISSSQSAVDHAYHLANKYHMREQPGFLAHMKDSDRSFYYQTLLGYLLQDNVEYFKTSLIAQKLCDISIQSQWEAFPFTRNVLHLLHQSGLKTGLISNWDLGCRSVLEACGLLELLDPIIISSELGTEKPDPLLFKEALEIVGCSPQKCLYVGDNYYDDVLGAQASGIDCILINPPACFGIEELNHPYIVQDIKGIFPLIEQITHTRSH